MPPTVCSWSNAGSPEATTSGAGSWAPPIATGSPITSSPMPRSRSASLFSRVIRLSLSTAITPSLMPWMMASLSSSMVPIWVGSRPNMLVLML